MPSNAWNLSEKEEEEEERKKPGGSPWPTTNIRISQLSRFSILYFDRLPWKSYHFPFSQRELLEVQL